MEDALVSPISVRDLCQPQIGVLVVAVRFDDRSAQNGYSICLLHLVIRDKVCIKNKLYFQHTPTFSTVNSTTSSR